MAVLAQGGKTDEETDEEAGVESKTAEHPTALCRGSSRLTDRFAAAGQNPPAAGDQSPGRRRHGAGSIYRSNPNRVSHMTAFWRDFYSETNQSTEYATMFILYNIML